MIMVFKQQWFRLLAFTACILLFSLFIPYPFPLRFIAFLCIFILAYIFATEKRFWKVFTGESNSRSAIALWTIIAVIGSLMLAKVSREDASLPLFPVSLGWFSFIAMMIGGMEELLFRGWMFSQFNRGWRWPAVIITSLAHAGYKALLFTSVHLPYEVNSWDLFLITFEAGIFLGLTRLFSRSVWPALIAHAIFDLLIYGDQQIPWWVF
jgi:membrane protease YdiL (CAAX protease family)